MRCCVSSHSQTGLPAQVRSPIGGLATSSYTSPNQFTYRVRARNSSNDSNGPTDWDAAWSSFRKQMKSQVDTQPMSSNQVPPLRRPPPRTSQEQLRRSERVLLDLYTSEDSLKWGPIALAAGLLVVLMTAGAPSSFDDGRCTLPWC